MDARSQARAPMPGNSAGGQARRDARELQLRLILFDDAEPSRDVEPERLQALLPLKDSQLLWIDVVGGAIPDAVARALGVDAPAMAPSGEALPRLAWRPPWKYLHVRALDWTEARRVESILLGFAVGPNLLVTQHAEPVEFITHVLEDESDLLRVGRLDAMTFAASLLDRMLTDYLDARDEFETAVDHLEHQILRKPSPRYLRELQGLRQHASALRQTLADHRDLFDALGRPDFDPGLSGIANDACRALRARYSHVIGSLESARELVNGSFDVYTSRIAESTNETMYVLTVATVVLGALATVAGVLGMNFNAPFFETGVRGFIVAVGGMGLFGSIVIGLTIWRRRRSRAVSVPVRAAPRRLMARGDRHR